MDELDAGSPPLKPHIHMEVNYKNILHVNNAPHGQYRVNGGRPIEKNNSIIPMDELSSTIMSVAYHL